MREQACTKLIDDIYEVPLAPGGWMALAPNLQEQFRAPFGIFMLHSTNVSVMGACGPVSDELVSLYQNHLWREDRAMRTLRSAPIGEIVLDSQLIAGPERAKCRFYNDFLAPQGLERGLYASVGLDGNSMLIVSAQRSARVGDYDLEEINLLRRVLPHLQRSFRTWQHVRGLEQKKQAALDAMEHADLGLILVDESGKLQFANRTAEEQLSGGALSMLNGRVTSRSVPAAQALHSAIKAAARRQRAVANRVPLPSGFGGPASVLVSPVQDVEADPNSKRLAMLVMGARTSGKVEADAATRAYDLTPAEARLLAALVDGERIGAYARRTGVSVTTAKSHLRALFDKVGERRQADLIRRVVATCS
jgi:DNA-binding NarL/FixJ family response regulator